MASLIGHKNATGTLNMYAYLWPSDEGRIVAAIDDVLFGSVRVLCAEGVMTGTQDWRFPCSGVRREQPVDVLEENARRVPGTRDDPEKSGSVLRRRCVR